MSIKHFNNQQVAKLLHRRAGPEALSGSRSQAEPLSSSGLAFIFCPKPVLWMPCHPLAFARSFTGFFVINCYGSPPNSSQMSASLGPQSTLIPLLSISQQEFLSSFSPFAWPQVREHRSAPQRDDAESPPGACDQGGPTNAPRRLDESSATRPPPPLRPGHTAPALRSPVTLVSLKH